MMRSPHGAPSESTNKKKTALVYAILLSLLAFAGQLVGSWYTGSLSLLGDTMHVFTDLFSLLMSLSAILIAAKPLTEAKSFGLYRLEVLATFLNGLLLGLVGIWLLVEAIERLLTPHEVLALPLIWISILGLVLNLLSAWLLMRSMKGSTAATKEHKHEGHSHHGHHHSHSHGHGHTHEAKDRNVQAALFHVLSDAIGSFAVIMGGVFIYFFSLSWMDSVIAIGLSFLIIRWSYYLLVDTVHVLLEGTPKHIQIEVLLGDLSTTDKKIHHIEDLHVWEITSGMYAATAEIFIEEMSLGEAEGLRCRLAACMKERYGIAHTVLAMRPHTGQPSCDTRK